MQFAQLIYVLEKTFVNRFIINYRNSLAYRKKKKHFVDPLLLINNER